MHHLYTCTQQQLERCTSRHGSGSQLSCTHLALCALIYLSSTSLATVRVLNSSATALQVSGSVATLAQSKERCSKTRARVESGHSSYFRVCQCRTSETAEIIAAQSKLRIYEAGSLGRQRRPIVEQHIV